MRIVVYGGRKFADRYRLWRRLDEILKEAERHGDQIVIIQGKAPGADLHARNWAIEHGVAYEDFPALWDDLAVANCSVGHNARTGKPYNKLAGFNRNQQMIDEGKPDWAIECPGENGTADMHRRVVAAGIPIFLLR